MVLQRKTTFIQYVSNVLLTGYKNNLINLFSLTENRFTPIYDFGYVAMNFGWVYPEDSGEYLCRATNLYGKDETRAFIKTAGKPGIIYDSQLPKGMKSLKQIREIEANLNKVPEEKVEPEKAKMKPTFVLSPDPVTIEEGEWARFCCRVTGHPRPRVMWLINGHTVVNVNSQSLNFFLNKILIQLYFLGSTLQIVIRRNVSLRYSKDPSI